MVEKNIVVRPTEMNAKKHIIYIGLFRCFVTYKKTQHNLQTNMYKYFWYIIIIIIIFSNSHIYIIVWADNNICKSS